MLKAKLNYKNDPKIVQKLWQCPECEYLYIQEHIIWCDRYKKLRENKYLDNDSGLTRYFQQVMLLREKTELVKENYSR